MDSKRRILNPKQRKRDKEVETPKDICPTLGENMWKEPPLVVSEPAKSTNGAEQSTPETSDISQNGETQEQLTLPNFQTSTSSVRDSLAKVSRWLERGEASATQEELSSLKYLESASKNDLAIFCLRMSKDSSRSTMGLPSRQSSTRFRRLGMTCNGKCLTANTSKSRRIGSGCSLSDILEESPDPKYFLSEHQMKRMARWMKETNRYPPVYRKGNGEDKESN